MPRCYLLVIAAGSSLDQSSNNVTLFNLVEQLNVPEGVPIAAAQVVPVELHAYWRFELTELPCDLETRFVLVSLENNLEVPSDIVRHRAVTAQLRTRLSGLPLPPAPGDYVVNVDWRKSESAEWTRDRAAWPLRVVERSPPRPQTLH